MWKKHSVQLSKNYTINIKGRIPSQTLKEDYFLWNNKIVKKKDYSDLPFLIYLDDNSKYDINDPRDKWKY